MAISCYQWVTGDEESQITEKPALEKDFSFAVIKYHGANGSAPYHTTTGQQLYIFIILGSYSISLLLVMNCQKLISLLFLSGQPLLLVAAVGS